jgi:SAM-dependent methyltransferase
VVGIDVSQEMIARARQLNGDLDNVSWVHGNGLDLQPLEDASVDLVVSLVVFQHIPDPNITLGYIRDIGRVLRPGGRAAIHVSNDPTVHRVPGDGLGVRERIMRLAGRSPRGREHSAWLGSAVELDQVASTAEAAGMTVAHVVGAGTQYCGLLLRRDSMGSER